MAKFWKQVSFWNKIKAVIAIFGVGGEVTMFATQQGLMWHSVTVTATIIGVIITQFIQDVNNNGVADIFENQVKKQMKQNEK